MVMQRRRLSKFATQHSPGQICEQGSVTAELAIAMPAVSMIIAITLGAFALQIDRMKLVEVSATAARAIARGEPENSVLELTKQMLAPKTAIGFEVVFLENLACVSLLQPVQLAVFGANAFELKETACARKMGL